MCCIHVDFSRSQKSDVYCRSLHFFPGLHCSPSPIALYSGVFQVALFLYSAVGNCTLLCCALRRATLHCGVLFSCLFLLCCFSLRVCRPMSVFPGTSVSRCVCLQLFDYFHLFGLSVCLSVCLFVCPCVCGRGANESAQASCRGGRSAQEPQARSLGVSEPGVATGDSALH